MSTNISNLEQMEEIVLINPPSFVEGTLNTQPIPLGLIFINRFLKEHGYVSSIINLSECKCWEEVERYFKKESSPRIIGISSYTRQRFSTIEMIGLLRSIYPETIICIGGPHATFLDEAILRHHSEIDFVIRGEGEETFLELVTHIFNNNIENAKTRILGISYVDKNGVFIRTADRPRLNDLSLLPLPLQTAEELDNLSMADSLKFHFPNGNDNDFKMAPIITSRGCNGNCSFCCNRSFWGDNRCTGAEYAYKQFYYYYSKGISCFDIYDDNFTSNEDKVLKLCDMLINNGIDVKWWCSSRVDTVNHKILKSIKQAGCFMISYGVESGSQRILNNINKGVTIIDVESACALTRQAGLSFRITISIGHLGETFETINETIDLINRIRPIQIAIFMLKVYPGTPLNDYLKKKHLISDDYWFNKDNDIVPLFTYEHTKADLLMFRNQIIEKIEATIVNRYEDELSSIELDLNWEK